jgi:hypothetical protein
MIDFLQWMQPAAGFLQLNETYIAIECGDQSVRDTSFSGDYELLA